MRLLITEGLVGVYFLDHKTTPEVVRISKLSNILRSKMLSYNNEVSKLQKLEFDKEAEPKFLRTYQILSNQELDRKKCVLNARPF